MSNSSDDTFSPKTEVWHGDKEIFKKGIEELASVKIRYDSIVDQNGPSIMVNNEFVIQAYTDIINRGCKIRLITEISANNISYCKKLSKLLDLRHFDEIKGNLGIVDGLRYGASARSEEKKFPTEYIYSTVKSFVEQQQLFFETLWNKSIPAEQRIKEIEKGIESIKTQLLQNPQEIFESTIEFYKKSNWIKSCYPVKGLNIIYRDFSNSRQEIQKRYRQGKHKGIRWITSLKSKKDVDLVKSYIDNGIKIRHVKEILADSFALSDKSFLFTIENVEEEKKIANVLSSNDKLYLDHYDIVFENLWKKGIDIEDRIKEIEKGYNFTIETISNSIESLKFSKELLQTVKNELLIMLASSSSFFRMEKNIGISVLENLTDQNIKVKVLIPSQIELHDKINQIRKKYAKIDFRLLPSNNETFIGITIVDRQKVLIHEIKDDNKIKYTDSVGMTLYIEGESTAMSYLTIFNSLWKQTEIYEKLEKAYEKSQMHEKMQKEFINVAAHELRTPIQPILGFTEHLKSKIIDKEQLEFLDVIHRNTKRLKKLSDDILEVSKIENNLLVLNKESFRIKDFSSQLISDFKNEAEAKNIEFEIIDNDDSDFFIYADKEKISQAISNLISNSIKFITAEKGGKISISVEKRTKYDEDNDCYDIIHSNTYKTVIIIKDNGIGIDEKILPMLFTKFASKSYQGTGLGLYICKNIVEAHGGKIWAKNNEDGKGAIFEFSLPLVN